MSDDAKVLPEETPEGSDSNAVLEATKVGTGTYKRAEAVKSHVHRAVLVIFWVLVASFLAMFLVWIFHLITPTRCHFLTDEQMNHLQSLLLSAMGSSVITSRARNFLDGPKEPS